MRRAEVLAKKNLRMEIDCLIADARREWANSLYTPTDTVYEYIAEAVARFIEDREMGQPKVENQGFKIWVPGPPAPWGMGRQVSRGIRLKPQRLKDFQDRTLLQWRRIHGSTQLAGPIQLDFAFHTASSSVDTSNMIKGAEDALKEQAFGDDDRVYRITAVKVPVKDKKDAGMEMCLSAYLGAAFQKHAEE